MEELVLLAFLRTDDVVAVRVRTVVVPWVAFLFAHGEVTILFAGEDADASIRADDVLT